MGSHSPGVRKSDASFRRVMSTHRDRHSTAQLLRQKKCSRCPGSRRTGTFSTEKREATIIANSLTPRDLRCQALESIALRVESHRPWRRAASFHDPQEGQSLIASKRLLNDSPVPPTTKGNACSITNKQLTTQSDSKRP